MKTKIDELRHQLNIKEGVCMGIHPDNVQNLLDIIEKQHEEMIKLKKQFDDFSKTQYQQITGVKPDGEFQECKSLDFEGLFNCIKETTEMLEGVEL